MFSLRMLLAMVAISAVYIAGLVYRTEWWHASILTLDFLIYAAALSAAILAKQHRAFFVVFAVFGLAYGVCMQFGFNVIPHKVIEDVALERAREIVEYRGYEDPFIARDLRNTLGYRELIEIGNSFAALMISLVAGVVAEAVVRRRCGKSE